MVTETRRGRTGFASMDPEKQKEIARRGGQMAQSSGKAHKFTQAETRRGGQKGGLAISRNRAHMAEIARKGVEARRRHTEAKRHHGQEP